MALGRSRGGAGDRRRRAPQRPRRPRPQLPRPRGRRPRRAARGRPRRGGGVRRRGRRRPVVGPLRRGDGFLVTTEGGRGYRARRLLVAAGVVDELPDVPGLRERWGTRRAALPLLPRLGGARPARSPSSRTTPWPRTRACSSASCPTTSPSSSSTASSCRSRTSRSWPPSGSRSCTAPRRRSSPTATHSSGSGHRSPMSASPSVTTSCGVPCTTRTPIAPILEVLVGQVDASCTTVTTSSDSWLRAGPGGQPSAWSRGPRAPGPRTSQPWQ